MSEKFESQQTAELNEKKLVPFEESEKEAIDILARFKAEIKQHYQDLAYLSEDDEKKEGIWDTKNGTDAISGFLEKVPSEVKEKFCGHGVSKGSDKDRLTGFLNIIANKTIRGSSGALESGFMSAYTDAPFFVISHYNQPLNIECINVNGKRDIRANEMGWEANIGAFVVNYEYYPIVDELKRIYPNEKIIKANELPEYINSEIGL